MRTEIRTAPDEIETLDLPSALIAWSERAGLAASDSSLPAGFGASIRELGERAGVTPSEVLLTAVQTLLHRYTSQEEVTVCVVSPDAASSGTSRRSFAGDPQFSQLLGKARVTDDSSEPDTD